MLDLLEEGTELARFPWDFLFGADCYLWLARFLRRFPSRSCLLPLVGSLPRKISFSELLGLRGLMDLLEEGIDVTLGRGSAVVQRLWCRACGGHFGIVLMEEGIELSYWNRECNHFDFVALLSILLLACAHCVQRCAYSHSRLW